MTEFIGSLPRMVGRSGRIGGQDVMAIRKTYKALLSVAAASLLLNIAKVSGTVIGCLS